MKGTKTIVACALTALAAGAGSASAAKFITGSDVQNNSLTGLDVKDIRSGDLRDGTIRLSDLNGEVLAAIRSGVVPGSAGANGTNGLNGRDGADGKAGATGATGATGDKGATGAAGLAGANGIVGVSGYEVRTYDYLRAGHRPGKDGEDAGYPGAGGGSIATVACSSPDKVATGGGYFIRNGNDDSLPGIGQGGAFTGVGGTAGVVASFPGRMDWSNNTIKPDRRDGWIVQFNGTAPLDVTLYVVCINAT